MVGLHVNGTKVGTLDENPAVLKQLIESGQLVEFRSDNGTVLGAFIPRIGELPEKEVELTRGEIEHRARETKRSSINDTLTRLGVV